MSSSNPTLGAFEKFSRADVVPGDVMTVEGTTVKTGILTLILATAFALAWKMLAPYAAEESQVGILYGWAIGAILVGFVLALIICFVQTTAPFLSPVYAVAEGVALAAISLPLEMKFPGIAIQAASLTILTLLIMMGLYRTGIIKVNDTFKTVVIGATLAVAAYYIISLLLGMFGVNVPGRGMDNSWFSIGISVVIVGIAALNLALDFDYIEQYSGQAPKYLEWYGAFSLLVTLVWLYIEILRLLAKLRSR